MTLQTELVWWGGGKGKNFFITQEFYLIVLLLGSVLSKFCISTLGGVAT
jgi:hypothetical protein